MLSTPQKPQLFHIVHLDRLDSIMRCGSLYSDNYVESKGITGTGIGINPIKQRRATKALHSHPNLYVGDCVPFYFCPRSVMLFVIDKGNSPDLGYKGGQNEILHFRLDMYSCTSWAETNNLKWAFTTSNAGSNYFVDYKDLNQLSQINWKAVDARIWKESTGLREPKQAEFLIEREVDFANVEEIGVKTQTVYNAVRNKIDGSHHKPIVNVQPSWYY